MVVEIEKHEKKMEEVGKCIKLIKVARFVIPDSLNPLFLNSTLFLHLFPQLEIKN